MIATRKRLLRAAIAAASLPSLFSTGARADVHVSVQYESEAQLELARRIESELLSEGYAVDVRTPPEPSPCERDGAHFVAVPQGTTVWIRLTAGPPGDDTIVASICYLGTLPFLQRASVRSASDEPHQLALAAAEAVNGLRSQLPPWAGNAEHGPNEAARPNRANTKARQAVQSEPLVNTVVVGTALVFNLPDFPAAPGVTARATLGLIPSVGIAIDALVPTSGRELTGPELTATVRTAWLRLGPRFRFPLGDFDLSGAALAGPALTWATAVAEPPSVGTTDVSTGAVLSLAAFVEYPRKAAVFACATASASTLLPGVKVDLGDGASNPRGSWPIEASIGFGARWGGAQR